MAASRLAQLTTLMSSNVATIEKYIEDNKLPMPSFDEEYAGETLLDTPAMRGVVAETAAAARELYDLLFGPLMCLRPLMNASSMQFIYRYNVASRVPKDGGSISYARLAAACDVAEHIVRPMVRHAIVRFRVFQEKEPGRVSHSAASRTLVDSLDVRAGMGMMFDDCYQAFAHTVDAIDYNKEHPDKPRTGWMMAYNTDRSPRELRKDRPDLIDRSARAMRSFGSGFGHELAPAVTAYEWGALPPGATIVDVGGADGHVGMAIAHAYPHLRVIVQDLPHVIEQVQDRIPPELKDRLSFQSHDYLTPQPARGADVFFFRQCFHNGGQPQCIQMLRSLIPALKPGAKVVVNDIVVPLPGVMGDSDENHVRGMDLIMLSLLNARERSEEDWRQLFADADPGFTKFRVWQPANTSMAMIEVTWSD